MLNIIEGGIIPIAKAAPADCVAPRYASVDIGSGKVRVNFYGVDGASTLVRCDVPEKTDFLCELAKDMSIDKPFIRRDSLVKAQKALRAIDGLVTQYGIAPENVCAIMTAAARAVHKTPQGKEDIAALRQAFGNRRVNVISGKEEALLVGRAAMLAQPARFAAHARKNGNFAFAAIGGGSVELGVIDNRGRIRHPAALPYGVLTLEKRSHGNIGDAGRIFNRALNARYRFHRYDVLCVTGGNWRALGQALRLQEALGGAQPFAPPKIHHLQGKEIRKSLVSATHRPVEAYAGLGNKAVRERAEFMRMSAAMLRRVADHFEAREVIFLQTSVRDALASIMFGLDSGFIESPPRGLKRLFVPSAPLQALRA